MVAICKTMLNTTDSVFCRQNAFVCSLRYSNTTITYVRSENVVYISKCASNIKVNWWSNWPLYRKHTIFSVRYDLNLLGVWSKFLLYFRLHWYFHFFLFMAFFSFSFPPPPSPIYCPKERIFCFWFDMNDSFAVSRTDLIHPYSGHCAER